MITGANSGIGKAMAIHLAKLGAHIIMVCRNETRGKNAQKDIILQSNNSEIELMLADLGDLSSIKAMVDLFNLKYSHLDVLINNAGIFTQNRTLSKDGYEMIFAVSYLGHFYLSLLLLNALKRSEDARIINVSSEIHKVFTINFQDIMFEKKFVSYLAYGSAKYANVLITKFLARNLEKLKITVNTFHPGLIKTNMTTLNPSNFIHLITSLIGPYYISAKKAAITGVYLASSPEVSQISGGYFKRCKRAKPHKNTDNIIYQKILWKLSLKLLKNRGIDVQYPF